MENQFIVGVADVRLYDETDSLINYSKTMLNTSMEISTSSTEISGGKRNKLLNIYYHSGRLNLNLEDTVFNMEWIRDNVGGELTTGLVPTKEAKLLTATGNVLSQTAKKFDGSDNAKVYIEYEGVRYQYNVDVNNGFTPAASLVGKNVCVEYYVEDNNAVSYTIPASIMPKRVRAVLDVDIASNRQGEGVIGRFIIEIPVLQLSGAQTISMTADGYSTTPLTGMALAFTPTAGITPCQNKEIYAIITKEIFNSHWYDGVTALAIIGGDFEATEGETVQLELRGITDSGVKSVVMGDLTFTATALDGATGVTVGTHTGLVTVASGATGSFDIKAYITNKPEVEAHVICTVLDAE